MIGRTPVCYECVHFKENLADNDLPGAICNAFPKGIPDALLKGNKHTEPLPGDHGIQFEKKRGHKGETLREVIALRSKTRGNNE